MIKTLKKLIKVDIDIDEIDLVNTDDLEDDKKSLYQTELEKNKQNENTGFINVEKKAPTIEEASYNEVSTSNERRVDKQPEVLKQFHEDITPLIAEESVDDSVKSNRRTFDFEKDIDLSYQEPAQVKKLVDESLETDFKVREQDLVNKDNYVLKDIISPMRGVVRKETNVMKKNNGHKKAEIIKLGKQIKAKEVEDNVYIDTVELPFEADTKDLEDSLNSFTFESEANSTLSETSRFTLIEDSTGKLSLAIDEEDEGIDNK